MALSADDQLPADIELVMAYRYTIPAERCEAALRRGLAAFPHLTGRISGGKIIPCAERFALETVQSPAEIHIRGLEMLPVARHSEIFIPPVRGEAPQRALFQARLTLLPRTGISVLGLRTSHAAVDGTGLAWFRSHCTGALRGVVPSAVFHDRRHGFGDLSGGCGEAPHGYSEADGDSLEDGFAHSDPTIFAIQIDVARKRFNTTSTLGARLRLGAWLCAEVAGLEGDFRESGLWCDPRK